MRTPIAILALCFGSAYAAPPSICLIGDSITLGESSGLPPSTPLSALKQRIVNRGVAGSSTWDWLPGSDLLESAKRDCVSGVVSIMLGTNDASLKRFKTGGPGWIYLGSETLPWEYRENLLEISNDLSASGFRVMLNYPPPVFNEGRDGALINEYAKAIDSLPDGVSVFAGDRSVLQYFADHRYLYLRDGVHPNQLGSSYLAIEWAASLTPLLTTTTDQRPQLLP